MFSKNMFDYEYLPAKQRRAPSEAASDGLKQKEVATLDSTVRRGDGERQRD